MERINQLDIQKWAQEYKTFPNVPASLLVTIASIESSFNPNAISPAGAMGLFQFMPITLLDLKTRFQYEFNPFNPKKSTIAAKIYFSWLYRLLIEDSLESVLIAYNWGIGNFRKFQKGEIKQLPKETQDYLIKFQEEIKVWKEIIDD